MSDFPYKPGDKVRVIDNGGDPYPHNYFDVGCEATVTGRTDMSYRYFKCIDHKGMEQTVTPSAVEPNPLLEVPEVEPRPTPYLRGCGRVEKEVQVNSQGWAERQLK